MCTVSTVYVVSYTQYMYLLYMYLLYMYLYIHMYIYVQYLYVRTVCTVSIHMYSSIYKYDHTDYYTRGERVLFTKSKFYTVKIKRLPTQ